MSLLEGDDALRVTNTLPTVTHIGFRNFMVPWLLSPEHMFVTNGFDALSDYVTDNPYAWTDASGSPIAFPMKPKQTVAEQKAAATEKEACELFVKKIMHTGFKLCMRWVYPKHVPEFAKFKKEDRVHFKWLQYDADLNILVASMRDNTEERAAVREYFTEHRYSMKVITQEDSNPPRVGAAFSRFIPWKDPLRETYVLYGHSVEPERPVAARAPAGDAPCEPSPSKRRRGRETAERRDEVAERAGTPTIERSESEVFGREVGPPFIQVVGAANGPPLVHAYTVTYAPAKVVANVAAPRRTAPKATQTPLSGGESGIEGARRWVEKFRGGGRKPRFADTA